MKTFEDFCRSNILQVILKYHNEGGSRDVERLTRMAYDEYTNSPHLRHISNYYLSEIRFWPPTRTKEEDQLCRKHKLKECSVDLGNHDNWCLKTERYLLAKLKRTDTRDNSTIANSKLYRANREVMIYKYCQTKFRQQKDEEAKLQKVAENSRRRESAPAIVPNNRPAMKKGKNITDFFQKQAKSAQMKRTEVLRLFNTPDLDLLKYCSGSCHSISKDINRDGEEVKVIEDPLEIFKIRPGPASKKKMLLIKQLMAEKTAQQPQVVVAAIETKNEAEEIKIPRRSELIITDEEEAVLLGCERPLDMELESIKVQLEERGQKVRPGPKSAKRAYLEKVIRKEEVLKQLQPKIKPCPASKKIKYLAKIVERQKEEEKKSPSKDQENISAEINQPPPTTSINKNLPVPLESGNKIEETSTLTPFTTIVPKKKPVPGSKLWMLMYGVCDMDRKCFYDPQNPPPPTIEIPVSTPETENNSRVQSPQKSVVEPELIFNPLEISSPMISSTQLPKSLPPSQTTITSNSTQSQSSPNTSVNAAQPPIISFSQLNPMDGTDNTIEIVLEKSARQVLHPKIFYYPRLLKRVKEMLVGKARLFESSNQKGIDDHPAAVEISQDSERNPVDVSSPVQKLNESFKTPPIPENVSQVVVDQLSRLSPQFDKSIGTISQDSQVTVIEAVNRIKMEPQTPLNPLKSDPKSPITSPEVIMCDQLATQHNFYHLSQPSQNPLMTQNVLLEISDGPMVVDSEVQINPVPDEVILVEDNNSMVDEILGESQDVVTEDKVQESRGVDHLENTPAKAVPVDQRTPSTKSLTKNVLQSPRSSPRLKAKQTVNTPPTKEPAAKEQKVVEAVAVVADPKSSVGNSKVAVAYRYNALPLQQKGVPSMEKQKPTNPAKKRKIAGTDIYTAVRFGEETEGTAADLDIQDASLLGDEFLTTPENTVEEEGEVTSKSVKGGQKVRSLLASLQDIARQQAEILQAPQAVETRPFTAHQISGLSYKADGKGKFYSDSCAQCSFAVAFTVDGMRRLQLDLDINRHLLNLTQDQWESFQRLLTAVEEFEYVGWEKNGGGQQQLNYADDEEVAAGGGGVSKTGSRSDVGSSVIKGVLKCLLKTNPKSRINCGAIRFSNCWGAKSVYLNRMPEDSIPDLDLTECLDERILEKLEKVVKGDQ